MGNVFVTADLHLGHNNIREYCNRPFASVEEMDEVIIDNWNKTVKGNDAIYVLGDFALGDVKRIDGYIKRLKGRIVFIKGNHDKYLLKWGRKNEVPIHESLILKTHNEIFFLSHYAHRTWNKSHYGIIHLFGHSHGGLADHNLSMDVGVDTNNFFPYAIDPIIEKMKPIREQLIEEGKIFVNARAKR